MLGGPWECESAVLLVVARVLKKTAQVGDSRIKRRMQERERTLDLTSLSVLRRTLSPGRRGDLQNDVSCQVGTMMRAPGPLKIARVDEGPALNSIATSTGLPMLICISTVTSGPEASTLADGL